VITRPIYKANLIIDPSRENIDFPGLLVLAFVPLVVAAFEPFFFDDFG